MPNTYAGWLGLLEQEKRERGKINPVQLVPVRPAEFEAYCKDRGVPGSSHILLRFAIEHAGPHEVEHDYDPYEKDGD